ncbi:MAG: hypothetical protein GY898_33210 [Proteobacteria bacterium]|nr:hypothetical protein [Pseudomonadota bacterium]
MSEQPQTHGKPAAWLAFFGLLLALGSIPALYDWRFAGEDCTTQDSRVLADEPERAARLADRLAANPTLADCTLQRHGMTRTDYIDLMDAISDSQALSIAYAEARKR